MIVNLTKSLLLNKWYIIHGAIRLVHYELRRHCMFYTFYVVDIIQYKSFFCDFCILFYHFISLYIYVFVYYMACQIYVQT